MRTSEFGLRAGSPVAIMAVAAALTAGCGGRATLQFVSLNTQSIDPPPARVWRFEAGRCCWWVDESGGLNIAMQGREANPAVPFLNSQVTLSLVLDKPPAGSGRDYRLGQREVRLLLRSRMQNQHLIASSGIVAVMKKKDGNYRGSFRIWMIPQPELQFFQVMPQQQAGILCFGSFEAVRDDRKGPSLRALTEAGGWSRPTKAQAKAPTTGPSAIQPPRPH